MSTLKVDTISPKTSWGTDGHPYTAPGMVLQVHEFHTDDYVTVSNTTQPLYNTSITTKGANSDILIMFNTSHSTDVTSVDVDVAVAMGWKVGAVSTDPDDYTVLHGDNARQNVDNLGAFWSQDTYKGSEYGVWNISFNKKHNPAQPAGTALSYASFGSTDGTFYVGTAKGVPGDTGMDSSIILMEIAG